MAGRDVAERAILPRGGRRRCAHAKEMCSGGLSAPVRSSTRSRAVAAVIVAVVVVAAAIVAASYSTIATAFANPAPRILLQ